MNPKLAEMSNAELKAYIAVHRNEEQACHEALSILLSRISPHAQRYPADLSDAEMTEIFRRKIQESESGHS